MKTVYTFISGHIHTAIIAGVILWLGIVFSHQVDRYIEMQAIDACAKYATVSWTDSSGVEVNQPNETGYEKCLKEKGLK